MKKQYFKYGTVFCILVLLAFLIVFVIFTKNKVMSITRGSICLFGQQTSIIMPITLTESWNSR